MGIAFLPIDIETNLPDEQRIIDYCNNQKFLHKGISPYWDTVPVLGRLENEEWYNIDLLLDVIKTKTVYTGKKAKYLNNFDKEFPELVDIIEQLPFKEISYAVLFKQTSEVKPHMDRAKDEIFDTTLIREGGDVRALDLEPKRYNILLTKHSYKSFYVSETIDSQLIYPVIPKNRACFAFSNDEHYHGANFVGENKIMLFLSGSLDKEKHIKLISKSLSKYSSEVIKF
ncbi:MAG: hypothetical protein RLZZ196_1186 [Bacteroidota bacterium]|jgi:hypothetical protein